MMSAAIAACQHRIYYLSVVQVSLEDDQVRARQVEEKIGCLGLDVPEGVSSAPESEDEISTRGLDILQIMWALTDAAHKPICLRPRIAGKTSMSVAQARQSSNLTFHR